MTGLWFFETFKRTAFTVLQLVDHGQLCGCGCSILEISSWLATLESQICLKNRQNATP